MVRIEFDIIPNLKIFKNIGVAIVTLGNIQVSRFVFDEFRENYRESDLRELKKIEKYNDYKCVDFYFDGKLINVVRNAAIEICGDN
jgi:hypothetical protein